ncbi:MAG TPA: GYF domain-containing protein [Planctomycetaceae bacterium]|nr:GYF domain-containing protein [Planctomycetaceae bacterium]
MSGQWYYRLFGEEFGPVPRETLTELAAKGMLGDSDEVRADGASDWQTVEQVLTAVVAPPLTASAEMSLMADESADDQLNWYYQFLGDEMGPVSFNELLNYASIGQLTADDQIKFGANGKWRGLGAIGRLVAVLPYHESSTALRPEQTTRNSTPVAEIQTPEPEPASPAAPPPPVLPGVPRYLPAAEERAWFAWIRGAEFGPTNLLEINQWVTSGQIAPTDFVRYGMMGQWAPPATALHALAQLRIPDPVAPPSPPVVQRPTMPVVAAPTKPNVLAVKLPEPPPQTAAQAPVETVAKASSAAVDIVPERPKTTPTAEERKPEPRPVMDPPRAESSAGGGGYGGGISAPPAWQTPAKPAYKPPPRKSSSGGGGLNLGGLMEPLKDGKTLGIIGGTLVAALLIGGWMFMPASKGADVARLQQLEKVLADFRKTRDEKGNWQSFEADAAKVTKSIVDDLKNTATRKTPAKQCLLWAARDALPRMLSTAKDKPGPAETEFENHLHEASRILGVGSPPPRAAPAEEENPDTT